MDPFAESDCVIRSERWVSLELEKIVLDSMPAIASIHGACRSGQPANGAVAQGPPHGQARSKTLIKFAPRKKNMAIGLYQFDPHSS